MIKFAVDHCIEIGKSHQTDGKPCQDYAYSKIINEETAVAVISDGCSTAGQTDIGARLVALSVMNALEKYPNQDIIIPCQNEFLNNARTLLFLEKEDLLATCILAKMTKQGGSIKILGDGGVAIKYKNGDSHLLKYEWENNTPFYPFYANNEDTLKKFIEVHGSDLKAKVLQKEEVFYSQSLGLGLPVINRLSLEEGIRGLSMEIKNPINIIDCIAVFSDGVSQINGMDWREAMIQLLDFKSTAGVFVKRRTLSFLKKCRKEGKTPIDDLGVAVIRLEENDDSDQKQS